MPHLANTTVFGTGGAGVDSRTGWHVAGWSFLALVITFGVAYGFSAFVEPISAELKATKAQLGWVFGIATFLFLVLGVITGRHSDRHGPRGLVCAGGLLIGCGLALSALAEDVRMLYLTYGLPVGVGLACVYIPVISNVGCWFARERAKALGVVAAGVGIGTLVGAPLAAAAVRSFGWRGAAVLMGVVTAVALLALAAQLTRAPQPAPAVRWAALGAAIRNQRFILIYLSGVAFGFALYMPLVFLPAFAARIGIDALEAATLISAIGIASAGARLLFGGLGDQIGPVRAYQLGYAMVLAAYAVWLTGSSYVLLLSVALLLGAGYGAITALTPVVLMSYFGREQIGAVIGAMTSSGSVGALAGAPLAGYLIGQHGYEAVVWIFCAIAACSTVAVATLKAAPKQA